MTIPSILIVTGDAAEALEVMYPLQRLRPVAAICHAALILVAAGVARGRTMPGYPALRCDVEGAGATFRDAEVVIDGNLVTSRAWPDHLAFMREFLRLLRKATSEAGQAKPSRRALADSAPRRR